jgi:hypothetical protein
MAWSAFGAATDEVFAKPSMASFEGAPVVIARKSLYRREIQHALAPDDGSPKADPWG